MPNLKRNGIIGCPQSGSHKNPPGLRGHIIKMIGQGNLSDIPRCFALIISNISKVQLVNILVNKKSEHKKIINKLKSFGTKICNIRLINCKTDRSWVRDSLPIFLKIKKNKKYYLIGSLMLGQNIITLKKIIKLI